MVSKIRQKTVKSRLIRDVDVHVAARKGSILENCCVWPCGQSMDQEASQPPDRARSLPASQKENYVHAPVLQQWDEPLLSGNLSQHAQQPIVTFATFFGVLDADAASLSLLELPCRAC